MPVTFHVENILRHSEDILVVLEMEINNTGEHSHISPGDVADLEKQ